MKTRLSKIFIVCLACLLAYSCEPDPPKPIDWHKDFSTWRSAVSDAPVKSTFKMLGHAQEVVMCVQRKSGKEYFTGLNVNDGKIVWQTLVPNGDSVAVADAHIFGSHFVFFADGKIRNINLLTGSYTWEVEGYNILTPDITGVDEHFFFSAQSESEPRLGAIFRGNTLTGDIEELLLAPYTDILATTTVPGIIGIVHRVDAVKVNGQIMLMVQSVNKQSNSDTFWGRQLLGFFNTVDNKWVWNVLMHDVGNMKNQLNAVKYSNGKIFTTAAGDGVCCINISDADVLWSNPFDRNMGDIAIINDDMVIIHGSIIRNIRISDGQQNWSQGARNGINLSKVSLHKGIVYLSDGYSGAAFEASSGKPEWTIVLEGPTHRKNNRLKGECVVVPTAEDAMVIYTSDLEVYAYKAITK